MRSPRFFDISYALCVLYPPPRMTYFRPSYMLSSLFHFVKNENICSVLKGISHCKLHCLSQERHEDCHDQRLDIQVPSQRASAERWKMNGSVSSAVSGYRIIGLSPEQ